MYSEIISFILLLNLVLENVRCILNVLDLNLFIANVGVLGLSVFDLFL
jgi:hypothetical protein